VIEQESSWEPHAIRYEPAFRSRYVAPLGLPPTEEVARSISWGLMQVMGQLAREHGFTGRFLSTLCDPSTGLDIGCIVLADKVKAADCDLTRALSLWNGGANSNYSQEVLTKLDKYRIS
jgi:soluble lytic murein transglycosylase-like protein